MLTGFLQLNANYHGNCLRRVRQRTRRRKSVATQMRRRATLQQYMMVRALSTHVRLALCIHIAHNSISQRSHIVMYHAFDHPRTRKSRHMYMNTHTQVHAHVSVHALCICIYTYVYIYMYICIHIYVCIYIYTHYIHTYIDIYI